MVTLMRRGFTLIELLVVLAIIAALVAIVSPKYFRSIDRAQETSLRTTLKTLRDAIDKFEGDQGRYPDSLDELVQRHYVRSLPEDPLTRRSDTWVIIPPPADSTVSAGVADVRSGAAGVDHEGHAYQDY